jgi:hypothetical protein
VALAPDHFHFNAAFEGDHAMVDASIGKRDQYSIYLRLKAGRGASAGGSRHWRALFARTCLLQQGYTVEVSRTAVDAWLVVRDRVGFGAELESLGRMIAWSQRLDRSVRNDADLAQWIDDYLSHGARHAERASSYGPDR